MGRASVEGTYDSEFSGFVQFCFGVLSSVRKAIKSIHAWRGSTDGSGGTSPSVGGLPRQGRREGGLSGASMHPIPARCAPGPACGGPVLLLQNRRTPAGLLSPDALRQTNKKAAHWAASSFIWRREGETVP